MASKKEKLVRLLERRHVISFDELVSSLGSVNTAKHYVMELKEFGVLAARDVLKLEDRRVVVFVISHENLELYKAELQRRKEKKAALFREYLRRRR